MNDIKKEIMGTVSACEKCGYTVGFHVAFQREKEEKEVAVKLLCPNCKQVYDLGLRLKQPLGEKRR